MRPASEIAGEPGAGGRCGFTVIELLVVLAVIVMLATLLTRASLHAQKAAALQSAPAIAAQPFAIARAKAMSLGQSTRVLVNIDAASAAEPPRFLRYLVVQVPAAAGWETVAAVYLPDGVYVVPGNFGSVPAGLFGEAESAWVRADGGTSLRSTALRAGRISSEPVQGVTAEQWVSVGFAPAGTTGQAGDLVFASGRPRVPGTFGAGESPVQLDGPEMVCGLSLSQYGAVVFIHDRAGF